MNSQASSNQIRVASVPFSQVYIRHLDPLDHASQIRVTRLPDPVPQSGMHNSQVPWWPPVMLNPEWVRNNHDHFDLMHIHFGFDALDPHELKRTITELRRFRKPLVYTVHDLVDPHQPDVKAHRALLDVLVNSADDLITLTDGAAVQVAARWGRAAHVLPHPHVVDFDTMDAMRARRQATRAEDPNQIRRVGVHLKGLRADISPSILEPLAQIVQEMPATVLQVNIHQEILDSTHPEYREDLARQLAEGHTRGRWQLVAHEYFSASELFEYFASLDISVLPYKYGTHSGWLEAALDTGVAVIAPTCGQYMGQHPSVAPYRWMGDDVDVDSLREALRTQLSLSSIPGLDATERKAQRQQIAQAHHEIYTALIEEREV